jgi:hypothetical protein
MRVTYHDNRGDDKIPYGFVYFDDDSRVVYASNEGVSPFDGPYWNLATSVHVNKAIEYLNLQFPNISWVAKR